MIADPEWTRDLRQSENLTVPIWLKTGSSCLSMDDCDFTAGSLLETVAQLRNGKAWTEILDVARDEHSDLIIMGVRGRNPVDVTLFGSTTNQVVRRASCPVLTVH